jgi:3-hydroxybutyryl-CoA dehydratase
LHSKQIDLLFTINDSYRQKFSVSEKIYKGFVDLFNDHNPLHIDDAFAKDNGFRQKVMHGNILNGFLSYFIGECLPVKNVIIHSQEIQYKLPVYLGDELTLEATVKDVHESVNTVELAFRFLNNESKLVSKGKIQIGVLL